MGETKEVRLVVAGQTPEGGTYLAMYLVLPNGQWSLALDADAANEEETAQVVSDMLTIAGPYLGVPSLV